MDELLRGVLPKIQNSKYHRLLSFWFAQKALEVAMKKVLFLIISS
jgi:hypothetical protein